MGSYEGQALELHTLGRRSLCHSLVAYTTTTTATHSIGPTWTRYEEIQI